MGSEKKISFARFVFNFCTFRFCDYIFSRDGFWDPDFIDEKTLGRIPYINEWTKTKPDGMGPNLERFGGKPYHYLPRKFTFYFKPVK